MDIHEYQAKKILKDTYGLPIEDGYLVCSPEDADHAVEFIKKNAKSFNGKIVIKAQAHTGGRGKAGGVKLVDAKDAKKTASEMLGMKLVTKQSGPSGKIVHKLYFENTVSIDKEIYLALLVDRVSSKVSIVASSKGGMDIEEVAHSDPNSIFTVKIDPATGFFPCQARNLFNAMGLFSIENSSKLLTGFVSVCEKLYRAFVAMDASQIEINPLVITTEGNFVLLDAKVALDESALFRHKEFLELRDPQEEVPEEITASEYGLSYIKTDGTIGCMVNGAGLAMATMDIIKHHGASPANFLDVGGNADEEAVEQALKIIMSDQHVKAILINIFGGIMKCDIIANGIIAAAKQVKVTTPLIVRLSGTNHEEGKRILDNSGLKIITANDLSEAAKLAVSAIKN